MDISTEEMINSVASDVQPANDTAPATNDAPQAKQETVPEFEYSALGKTIKEPLPMILKRASQGYDYAQKMHDIKQQFAEIEAIKKQNEELKRWKDYDEYAKSNPEWNKHVSTMWENRSKYSDPNLSPDDPVADKFNQIMQKFETGFGTLQEKIAQFDKFREDFLNKAEYDSLSSEIAETKKLYKDYKIDFDTPDEYGQTLTNKVLSYMREKRIPEFLPAFRAVQYDNLIGLERERAKQSVADELQKRQKAGIVGTSSTSLLNSQSPKNLANMNYDQLMELALKELEQTN